MSVYDHHDHDGRFNSCENIVARRVRVIPGSLLSMPTPPSPPSFPPPKPAHLCKIAVVGDAFSGKTALVQKFIHRRYVDRKDVEACDGGTDSNGISSSATSNSIGTSSGATSYDESESTLAEYHKKDVTIWDQILVDQKQKNAQMVCIRVQLWDMNIHQYFTNQQNDSNSNSVHSESSSVCSPRYTDNIAPLLPLLKRINGTIIVCRCPPPPSSSSHSPNTSYSSNASNDASYSEWPELDSLEQQIQRWTKFLRDQLSNESQWPIVFVSLACADLVIEGYSPREWMRLSIGMQDICEKFGIDSWKMGTCINSGSTSVDQKYSQHHQPALLMRMFQKQKQSLEDMEDDVEAAFIGMISMHLDRSRRLHEVS